MLKGVIWGGGNINNNSDLPECKDKHGTIFFGLTIVAFVDIFTDFKLFSSHLKL